MKDQPLLEKISAVRRDLGNLLFHFTRSIPEKHDVLSDETTPAKPAHSILSQILREGQLRGANGCIKGKHNCVCFTEAPISEMVSLFNLARITAPGGNAPRYEPYGIAVTKRWLFAQGGRPVIYQTLAEYDVLPPELQYRHVTYDPGKGIDFSWEREWRIKTDVLKLDPRECIIIVPEAQDAFYLTFEHVKFVQDESYFPPSPEPRWLAVSLDFFGLYWK